MRHSLPAGTPPRTDLCWSAFRTTSQSTSPCRSTLSATASEFVELLQSSVSYIVKDHPDTDWRNTGTAMAAKLKVVDKRIVLAMVD